MSRLMSSLPYYFTSYPRRRPPMAPSVAEIQYTEVDELTGGRLPVNKAVDKGPTYPFYAPYSDVNEKEPPIEPFEHIDPGLRADPAKPNLLTKDVQVTHISPYLGTEIRGVQLSKLSKEGLDELALYTAERKVLIFRDQDFKDIGPERQIEIARHFGPIHHHVTSGNVKGYPEFHIVYRDTKNEFFKDYFGTERSNHTSWHSDVSFERQPAGTTFFFILDQPETGGDTLFASQVEAYNRLSPAFKKLLEGLRAVHSGVEQVELAKRLGEPIRRAPVEFEHPVVRTHPVTGEKALYVNVEFTRRIVGFKKEESDALLNFLYDHVAKGADFHIRARYEPGTVAVWDNRVTVHSATPDFSPTFRRHAARLTPQAEIPVE